MTARVPLRLGRLSRQPRGARAGPVSWRADRSCGVGRCHTRPGQVVQNRRCKTHARTRGEARRQCVRGRARPALRRCSAPSASARRSRTPAQPDAACSRHRRGPCLRAAPSSRDHRAIPRRHDAARAEINEAAQSVGHRLCRMRSCKMWGNGAGAGRDARGLVATVRPPGQGLGEPCAPGPATPGTAMLHWQWRQRPRASQAQGR